MLKPPFLMKLSAFFSHTGNPYFWEEVSRAHLLLLRLNNSDYSNSITHNLLKRASVCTDTRIKYHAVPICCYLYGAWSALSEQAKNRTEYGYEPNERFLIGLESANDHIFWRAMPYLNTTDFNKTLDCFPSIYSQVSVTISTGNISNLNIEKLISNKFGDVSGI